MISWIQNTFQRHFRTIFALLLGVIIISFVFTIGASPGLGGAQAKHLERPFFDLNLSNAEDQERLFQDANLSIVLQVGYPALQENQLQQYALNRYAGLYLANELGLPAPSVDEIAAHIRTLGSFTGQDGQFDAKRYSDFRDNLKTNPNLTEADVSRVLADDLRFTSIQTLVGGPGYVLPGDIKSQLIQTESKWSVAVASVDLASFNPKIDTSDASLSAFFTNNSARYETPPRVRVDYIDFPAFNYVSQVSLTDAEIRAYYDANPARFPKPETAVPNLVGLTGPDADFTAVRPQVEAAMKLERARVLAVQAASDLSVALYESKISADTLPAFLAARGLALKSAPLIESEKTPAELGGSPQVATEAFKLNESRKLSDAIGTSAGAVILVWRESLPPQVPALATVRDQVVKDFTAEEKRRKFVELGATLRANLQTALKAGQSFADAAKTVGQNANVTIAVKDYAAFTRRQPPADLESNVLGVLNTLSKGDVSAMLVNEEKGLLVYGIDKVLPDLSASNPAYAETRDSLAQRLAATNSQSYLQALVQRELARSSPTAATP